jgi:uncharacterized DUF497 family protein
MYIFHWDEAKRRSNLLKHGFDFADAAALFNGTTFTREDTRFPYSEQRFITLGLLQTNVMVLVHTESRNTLRIISLRKATTRESQKFFAEIAD